MQRLLGILFVFLLATSCQSEPELTRKVEETHAEGSPKKVLFLDQKGYVEREEQFHANGQLYIIGHYEGDERHGEWNSFYEDGKKWSENIYANGLAEGPYANYYENGQLRSKGEYKADKQVGKWLYYDQAGSLVKEVDY